MLASFVWLSGLLVASLPTGTSSAPVQCGAPEDKLWGSSLWGCHGELWDPNDPNSRIVDWSYAGYMGGYAKIPDYPVVGNLKEFGAKGDNKTDDTRAFLRAIRQLPPQSTLYIPEGVYKLSKRLVIPKSMVLRGAGSKKTFLWIPKSLTQIYGNSYHMPITTNNSDYCWAGGFISATGRRFHGFEAAGKVVEPALRGGHTIKLTSVKTIMPGNWIIIEQSHTFAKDGSMCHHLMGGLLPGMDIFKASFFDRVKFIVRVTAVDPASMTVSFDRALPHDIRPEWGATAWLFEPDLQGVGVEGLSLMFPDVMYDGHHSEAGFNGIFFFKVAHSWIKDVRVHNADNAILLKMVHHSNVENITLTSVYRDPLDPAKVVKRWLNNGHMGIGIQGGGSNLVRYFYVNTSFAHDIVVDSEMTSVFADGRGIDLRCDHHRGGPFANLFTNLDAGNGNRILDWRGPPKHGPHSAAYTTLYNVRAKRSTYFYNANDDNGPFVNLVNLNLSFLYVPPKMPVNASQKVDMTFGSEMKWLIEPMDAEKKLAVPNLYDAMVQARREREQRQLALLTNHLTGGAVNLK